MRKKAELLAILLLKEFQNFTPSFGPGIILHAIEFPKVQRENFRIPILEGAKGSIKRAKQCK